MEKMIYAVSAMMICCATSCTQSERIEKPNIMVILLDDAGYNDFGFKGSKDLLTPNIDRLAADGMVFTDAHVSASVKWTISSRNIIGALIIKGADTNVI